MKERNRYFLECHIKDEVVDYLRATTSENPQKEPHLHITFVRPFGIIEGREDVVKQKIVDFCKDKKPIRFVMEGKDVFEGGIVHVPVKSFEMLEFNNQLEQLLEGNVVFDDKIADEKVLHVTPEVNIDPLIRTEGVMLRLVCIRDAHDGNGKRIFFSYDLMTHEFLDREESLDFSRWQKTKELYNSSLS